ncbi:hypothetical protein Poli38472_012735 [Pythium oligandrum]|uniref:Vesicle transport protein n=1 Tax=Pythium oligandrum TaxID=41045 RepID=A0A8K1FHZ8_PYTOL|nr:hypothetical protein Poli38472_012735 [Pythium oligandrum]|eukprot:TMW61544.1 hypothetical protein Poli38472_012735 [Pythium oligandrum]
MLDRLRQQKQKLLDPESGRESAYKEANYGFCPGLTYQERVIGCLTCFLLGFLLSIGSTFRFVKLVHGNPGPFAVAYTIGNLLSICSSMFFVGPCKQIETMFRQKRRGSAILYIGFIVLTLVLCFSRELPHRVGLVMISILCQFVALVWYTLSYVPYGRQIVLTCCKRMAGMSTDEDL